MQKINFSPEAIEEHLHEQLDDGTVIKPVLRTSMLKEHLQYDEINAFANQHIDRVIKIQRAAKRYVALKNLKQLVKNTREVEQHTRHLTLAEYLETTADWLAKLISDVRTNN